MATNLLDELRARRNRTSALALNENFSEDFLATQFVDSLINAEGVPILRYINRSNRWMVWTGTYWVEDAILKVFEQVRTFLRHKIDPDDPKSRRVLGKAITIAAVERLARCDVRCASTIDQWDYDPMVLNTPEGIVDLSTGELLKHSARNFITRSTKVSPGGDCTRWLQFLDEITRGDQELQRFLARMIGYGLTGLIKEHALFFLYGPGGNGKGIFLNTLKWLLGDYVTVAPMETFTASTNDRHPTELAMLRGARLVVSQETEEGRRWAESRLKTLTGGDPITARHMRCDFFTFEPEFKLIIAGNHKPTLRSVGEAMRRRLHFIPFTVSIPKHLQDENLLATLRASEGPGILTWAINGCLGLAARRIAPAARGAKCNEGIFRGSGYTSLLDRGLLRHRS